MYLFTGDTEEDEKSFSSCLENILLNPMYIQNKFRRRRIYYAYL